MEIQLVLGFQRMVKRNSRDKDVNETNFNVKIIFWKISDKTNLNSGITHQFGSIGTVD
jgi:hypothetical protein